MTFATSSMWGAISLPTTKAPINVTTFVTYVLPPVLLYFIMAALVITSQTRTLRMACWPVLLLLAWRAAFSLDMALSTYERKFDNDLLNPMLMIVIRSGYWAFIKGPLVRHIRPSNSTPSTFIDALDLALAFRGYGWDWSRGMYIPQETRPSKRYAFLSHVALSAVVHAFLCGTSHRAIRSFSPAGLGSISGGTIFDESLPLPTRYFRSSIITFIGTCAIYSLLQMTYDLSTLVGILFLGQDTTQWPPGFDAPWRSTSLSQFWGRRWHQWLRHIFLVQGGFLLSFLFGRWGFVTGAFLSSAVYHHAGLNSLDNTSKLWRMVLGFGMMVPGMFVEQIFRQITGRKVSGMAGWFWTVSWLLLWGNVLIDGFVRAGLFRAGAFIDHVPPLRKIVEHLVVSLDTWLHSVA